jgi:hypothetical protein
MVVRPRLPHGCRPARQPDRRTPRGNRRIHERHRPAGPLPYGPRSRGQQPPGLGHDLDEPEFEVGGGHVLLARRGVDQVCPARLSPPEHGHDQLRVDHERAGFRPNVEVAPVPRFQAPGG